MSDGGAFWGLAREATGHGSACLCSLCDSVQLSIGNAVRAALDAQPAEPTPEEFWANHPSPEAVKREAAKLRAINTPTPEAEVGDDGAYLQAKKADALADGSPRVTEEDALDCAASMFYVELDNATLAAEMLAWRDAAEERGRMAERERWQRGLRRLADQAQACANAPDDAESAPDVYRWIAQRIRQLPEYPRPLGAEIAEWAPDE